MARKKLTFDEAVIAIAKKDGAEFVVTQIPGVWSEVSEYYNNDAIKMRGDFDAAVIKLAKKDGAEFVVTQIPGVWAEVSEYYNNDAIDRMSNPSMSKKRGARARNTHDPGKSASDFESELAAAERALVTGIESLERASMANSAKQIAGASARSLNAMMHASYWLGRARASADYAGLPKSKLKRLAELENRSKNWGRDFITWQRTMPV